MRTIRQLHQYLRVNMLVAVCWAGATVSAFAQADTTVYDMNVIAHPPVFPGCETADSASQLACSLEGMQKEIVRNLKFLQLDQPVELWAKIILGFVVEKDGTYSNVRRLRVKVGSSDSLAEYNQAAADSLVGVLEKDVIALFGSLPKAQPALMNGDSVRCYMTLPIKWVFRPGTGTQTDSVFEFTSPIYPGCEDVPEEERMECLAKKILTDVMASLRYPPGARDYSVVGKVTVQFVIDPEGKLEEDNIIVKQSACYSGIWKPDAEEKAGIEEGIRLLEQAAIDALKKAVKQMVPGQENGKPVRVYLSVPVTFKLTISE